MERRCKPKKFTKYLDRDCHYKRGADNMPLIESDRLLLHCKKVEICIEIRMFKFKQDVIGHMSEVIARIDKLED